jgi:putative FmdB family regulatory protein
VVRMPHHDFYCHACKKSFSKMLTLAQYEKGKVICPRCGSRKVEQQVSPFYAVTSKKSQSSAQENGIPPSQNEDSRERVYLSASEEDDRARVLSDWESEGGASRAEKQTDNAAEEKPELNNGGH